MDVLTQVELHGKYETSEVQLVCTKLDLAITFCKLAATKNNRARFFRNIAKAERAYASAAYYLDSKLAQNSEIREKLTQLGSLLSGIDGDS